MKSSCTGVTARSRPFEPCAGRLRFSLSNRIAEHYRARSGPRTRGAPFAPIESRPNHRSGPNRRSDWRSAVRHLWAKGDPLHVMSDYASPIRPAAPAVARGQSATALRTSDGARTGTKSPAPTRARERHPPRLDRPRVEAPFLERDLPQSARR